MKLTAKQRAEVVELLRCAADLSLNGPVVYGVRPGIGEASLRIYGDVCNRTWEIGALSYKYIERADFSDSEYAFTCLEAAARVEEKNWP